MEQHFGEIDHSTQLYKRIVTRITSRSNRKTTHAILECVLYGKSLTLCVRYSFQPVGSIGHMTRGDCFMYSAVIKQQRTNRRSDNNNNGGDINTSSRYINVHRHATEASQYTTTVVLSCDKKYAFRKKPDLQASMQCACILVLQIFHS